ncbi:prepilin-type N-terminal cleavage/methylation domain-containing protein [Cytobacillus sp. FJAT-53684]|uniref:Prepilin-type N-terminal cleavage/methylation domain-containing protein n=1 Tax=Cytobacillus mangrovibacter TaxID=3299024 RepID=A0ABW6JZG0_9BACI
MKFKKVLSSSKGLTLIEVLLSLTILGIILMGSMKFFSQAYSYTNMNQKKTAAINVARNALMYIEKDNFIVIRDTFENKTDEELSIYICKDKYSKFWKEDDIDSSCNPIKINNVEYKVMIRADKDELDKVNYNEIRSYYFPLTAYVTWTINGKENSTVLEGAIKSEDIR